MLWHVIVASMGFLMHTHAHGICQEVPTSLHALHHDILQCSSLQMVSRKDVFAGRHATPSPQLLTVLG